MRFCIHVVNDDDHPCYGEKVTIHSNDGWQTEETDDDGNAFFDVDDEDECRFQLFIGKYDYGNQTCEDDDSLTFTINEGVGTFKFTIHVVRSDDEPAKNIRVYCDFGLWNGGLKEHTDEDGNAEFKIHTSKDKVEVEVYVDGESMGDQWVEDGDSLTFTLESDDADDESKDDEDD